MPNYIHKRNFYNRPAFFPSFPLSFQILMSVQTVPSARMATVSTLKVVSNVNVLRVTHCFPIGLSVSTWEWRAASWSMRMGSAPCLCGHPLLRWNVAVPWVLPGASTVSPALQETPVRFLHVWRFCLLLYWRFFPSLIVWMVELSFYYYSWMLRYFYTKSLKYVSICDLRSMQDFLFHTGLVFI